MNGRQLAFFGAGDGVCYAFDPNPVKEDDTAFLKKVWWYDCNPPERKKVRYPEAEGPSEINSTPALKAFEEQTYELDFFSGIHRSLNAAPPARAVV